MYSLRVEAEACAAQPGNSVNEMESQVSSPWSSPRSVSLLPSLTLLYSPGTDALELSGSESYDSSDLVQFPLMICREYP